MDNPPEPPVPIRFTDSARRQHGLVMRSQLRPGLSSRQVDRLLSTGRLEPVRRGVYRVGGAPPTWEQLVLAAVMAGGPGAFASFTCAAALWRLDRFDPDRIEITVPEHRRARLPGVVVHDTMVQGRDHVGTVARIPTASVARTICDLSSVLPEWRVGLALDDSLRRKLTTIDLVRRVAESLEGRGRRRCTITRRVLEQRLPGFEPGESEPERRLARALVDAGLPTPTVQHRVQLGNRTMRIDLAYPTAKIAIEYDSWQFHSSRSSFDRDRARGNALELRGWLVLRFTSASSMAVIIDTLRTALARGSDI